MNIYFLGIALLQLSSVITPVSPLTIWVPLIFIFTVSAIKEAADDIGRWKEDKRANERNFIVLENGVEVYKQSKELKVGEVVKLMENEESPCDILILKSEDHKGNCYIQTASLDGETDLKPRQAFSKTNNLSPEELCQLEGTIECAHPNPHIYNFDSRVILPDDTYPVNEQNVALQATVVKNVKWIYGVVVYTGDDTKFGQNKRPAPSKTTKIDKFIDKMTLAVFSLQLACAIGLGIGGNKLNTNLVNLWYLHEVPDYPWYWWAIIPLRFLLLLSLVIPISLKVTIDVVKYAYALFINWDIQMYDHESNTPACATSTAISEDLAQIEYVFTDKTGTLTENIMKLKFFSISEEIFEVDKEITSDDLNKQAVIFLKVLALCQSVIPSEDETGSLCYKASSPDEEALVKAAANIGVVFTDRSEEHLELNLFGKTEKYELIHTLEFTSERKRMSVLVKTPNNKILLLSKGADEVIFPRSKEELFDMSKNTKNVENFSRQGYRTLVVGCREIPEDEYKEWKQKLKVAKTEISNRAEKLDLVYDEIEQKLDILGIAAIEDKLQDGVPQTIEKLREAGIRVWMLTGDKFSTAKQIALSCRLISSESPDTLLVVAPNEAKNLSVGDCIRRHLESITSENDKRKDDLSIIIEGKYLHIALEEEYEMFTMLMQEAKTVICCRVTPQQKALVVRSIKKQGKVTLAIGDGGNDVSMIQEASIGIGIAGREGLQAARASDYSFAKFKFLQRLLFVHGHYSYHRTAFVGHYCFHKSLFIALVQVCFAGYNRLSGASFFNSFSLATYNVFFTGLPILFYCLDRNYDQDTLMNNPELYKITQQSCYMNVRTFLYWVARSFYQSTILFFFALYFFDAEHLFPNGRTYDSSLVSMVAFTSAVIIQTLTIIIESNTITIINSVIIVGTFLGYFGIISAANAIIQLEFYEVMFQLYVDPGFWLCILLITMAAIVPFYALKVWETHYGIRIKRKPKGTDNEIIPLLYSVVK